MSKQCTAMNRKGRRCRRSAVDGQNTCRAHADLLPATASTCASALPPEIYSSVLTTSDQEDLVRAYHMEGLDAEIAVLRVLLKRTLAASPDNPAAVNKMMDGLVKALVARHRIGGDSKDGLDEALSKALTELSNELGIPL